MIVFRSIKWKNFLSTGNVFSQVKLNEQPNVLIVGENGAGKSTLLDALYFVLYGKPFRKVKKDQLVNSVNKKDTVVEIDFVVNGKQYTIIRGLKPSIFEIYEDGTLIDQHAASKDTQEFLETTILRLNSKSFAQIVILGSSSFVPFMQLPTSIRREVIEDLLDIRIFSIMQSLLRERSSSNKDEILINSKDVESILEIIKLQEYQAKVSQIKIVERVELHRARIGVLTDSVEAYVSSNSDLLLNVQALQQTIQDESINDAAIIHTATIKNDLKTKQKSSQKSISFYEDNGSCPTCTQEIGDVLREEAIKKKRETISKIDAALLDLDIMMINHDLRRKEIERVSTNISSFQRSITSNLTEIQKDQREIGVVQREIDTALAQVHDRETTDNINDINEKRDALYKKKEELLNAREVLDMANIILRDSGIKSRIIKQYIPIINSLVNKYLAAMDFFVKFELDENFEEKILSRHRDDFTYDSFSEGEKMRIDLSLLFTWRTIARMKNSAATNLLILDEVFDASLDANGCEEFLKLIHSLEDANVFVISHKGDIMQDKFRSTIRFEKHKNFSRIAN